MKLHVVEENSQKLAELADRLNRQVKDSLLRDLNGLVTDPNQTYILIRRGMTAPQFVLADRRWAEAFLGQWYLLSADDREEIFDNVANSLLERIQRLRSEGVVPSDLMLAEGALSSIGGFLSKLAKFAILIVKLLVAAGGGRDSIDTRSVEGLRVFNPYAVYILTRDLRRGSLQVARRNNRRRTQVNP